jgi:hypothetical protein
MRGKSQGNAANRKEGICRKEAKQDRRVNAQYAVAAAAQGGKEKALRKWRQTKAASAYARNAGQRCRIRIRPAIRSSVSNAVQKWSGRFDMTMQRTAGAALQKADISEKRPNRIHGWLKHFKSNLLKSRLGPARALPAF